MENRQKRQGDLLIIKIEEFDKKKMEPSTLILAEGEVTGHKHQLKGQVQVFEFENQKYIQVQQEKAELIHEEHQKLELEKGFYKVVNQREYSYLNEQIRRVSD